jgi:hypothetical protein
VARDLYRERSAARRDRPNRGAPTGPGCHCWPVAGAKLGGAAGTSGYPWALCAPVSRYEVKARTVILAVLPDWHQLRHVGAADRAGSPPRIRCREGTVPVVPQGVRLLGRYRPLEAYAPEGVMIT